MKYTLVAKTYILTNIIGSIFMLFGHGNRRVWVYLFHIKKDFNYLIAEVLLATCQKSIRLSHISVAKYEPSLHFAMYRQFLCSTHEMQSA